MQNKKVLIITNMIYPDSPDGSRYTYDLAKIFSKNQYDVTVVTSRFKKGLKKEEILDNIAIYRYYVKTGVPIITYLTNMLFSFFTIRRIVKIINPSLVVITGILPGFSYLFFLRNSKHGINISICNTLLHSEQLSNQSKQKWLQYRLYNYIKKVYESFVFDRVSKIIAISRNIENAILDNYPFTKRKLAVVEPGVDINTFVIGNKKLLREKMYPNKKVFLFVGRFQQIKGPDIAIDFALEMKKNYNFNNFILLMLGFGPLENELKQKISENKLGDVVNLLGVKHGSELVQLYQRADFLISSSRSETFPLVVLEALACGTPVISTPTEGPKEILGELAEHFVAKDFTGRDLFNVAQKFIDCDEELYSELSKKCRLIVENKFSLDDMFKKIIVELPSEIQ